MTNVVKTAVDPQGSYRPSACASGCGAPHLGTSEPLLPVIPDFPDGTEGSLQAGGLLDASKRCGRLDPHVSACL